ncbi:hypothetical protein [uncultured Corynebacterium sp.]|uniref:hypothetical protein n=1 Tax=uncultured Corynebacterium sp. TaxID=159447 RepID=UPI0025CC2102|nr:hypothetical protein [uncultured Corynebacterium sp.]
MNLANINTAVKVARSAWDKFSEVREEKAREAYATLESAANSVTENIQDSDLFPQSRQQAGAVTKAAHARLERTLEELATRRDEAREELTDHVAEARKEAALAVKEAKKSGKKQVKAARKEAKATARSAAKNLRAQAKARTKAAKTAKKKQKGSTFWSIAGILALIAALGGAAFYLVRNVFVKETPSENPPRVEEFGADKVQGSTLVYTSTSAADDAPAKESDLVEQGVTERDEELLGSLDEQLAKHAKEDAGEDAEEDAEDTDGEDGAKHRLNES